MQFSKVMRVALALVLFLAPALAGCVFDHGPVGSGRDCLASSSVQNGFRVEVPAQVGDPPAQTEGLCVRMTDGTPGGSLERKVGSDQVAWFPVAEPDHYRFHLDVTEPDDRYCAYVLEGEGNHTGSGIVTVPLRYQDQSVCA